MSNTMSKTTTNETINNAKAKATATFKKQTSAKSSDKKQSSANNDFSLSAVKRACVNVASLADLASDDDKKLTSAIIKQIDKADFHVIFKNTTSCVLFIVDDNRNTVCNVYDCLRIQFTTVQARKYKDALLADSRFYTHLYKNNQFISCKCKTFTEFIDAMQFVYSVYTDAKKQSSATATEQTAKQQSAK